MKNLGTGRELARLPIDGTQRFMSAGHPALIPQSENKCSKSVSALKERNQEQGKLPLVAYLVRYDENASFDLFGKQV